MSLTDEKLECFKIDIQDKYFIHFKPSKKMKQLVNGEEFEKNN